MIQKIRPFLYEFSARVALLLGRRRKFMNLGYGGITETKIESSDSMDAHHISLYLELLEKVPGLRHRKVAALEIGCGRGGGCYVMQKYFGIKDISAMDLSSSNIKLAKKNVPGVNFRQDNATTFQTGALFDLILNLESSHAYPSRKEFFKKVSDSLRSSGHFAFGDLLNEKKINEIEEWMKEAGFTVLYKETINAGVIKSIEKNSRKQYPLVSRFPFMIPKKIHRFLATIHSDTYKHLKSGELSYDLYVLQKI